MLKRSYLLLLVAVFAGAAAFLVLPGDSQASAPQLRIYAIQRMIPQDLSAYVELRMTDDGQEQLAGYNLCFFDYAGSPIWRFTFDGNVANGSAGSSVLIGNTYFDGSWAAGSPDFTFTNTNTVHFPNPFNITDSNGPLSSPGGKIAFGNDTATSSADMCKADFTIIDSLAYGIKPNCPNGTCTYYGPVEYGTQFQAHLAVPWYCCAGTPADNLFKLQAAVCFDGTANPCSSPRDNSTDWAVVDPLGPDNKPRNNSGQQGPFDPDLDDDGVYNNNPGGGPHDLCSNTPAGEPVDAYGCSQTDVDTDHDGFCNPNRPPQSAGPNNCTGVDICPTEVNGGTPDSDGDGSKDSCDSCPSWPNASQTRPSWPVPVGDSDCDGFPDSVNASGKARETYIGTDPTKHCAATSAANDEGGADAMPPDFNDDRLINGQDTGKYGGPGGAYNHTVGQGPFNGLPGIRFDFNGDGIINGQDTGKFQAYFNKSCT